MGMKEDGGAGRGRGMTGVTGDISSGRQNKVNSKAHSTGHI